MHPLLRRWAFILTSTLIMVYFSEKMYWYVQGYVILELVMVYAFATYSILWAIEHFKISDFWGLTLTGVLYPLFIEGVFTGIITSDLSGIMLFYFVGWHTTLAVLIGWYWHRRLLIHNQTKIIALSSVVLGFILGLWATTFWLPENINGPELSPVNGFIPGKWAPLDYALLQLYLGTIYIFSHYVLSKFWIQKFRPTKWENYFVLLVIVALLILQAFTFSFFIIFLLFLYLITLASLKRYSQTSSSEPLFGGLGGEIRLSNLLLFYLIPVSAIVVYTLIYYLNPPESLIRSLFLNGMVAFQTTYGFLLLIISLFRPLKSNPLC